MIPLRFHENMVGTTSSADGVLTEFLMPILPKIDGYPMVEALSELHWMISGNTASMKLKL